MADDISYVNLDRHQIRVLAHPLRSRLLGRLRADGPATATTLAEKLGTNTGATSYHLRQLAEAGLVVEQEREGGGRQRWWRAAHDMSNWRRSSYDDDPEAAEAAAWMEGEQLNRLARHAGQWRRVAGGEPAEWRDAAGISDYLLTLTAAETQALLDELNEVVVRHKQATGGAARPGARQMLLYLAVVPEMEEDR